MPGVSGEKRVLLLCGGVCLLYLFWFEEERFLSWNFPQKPSHFFRHHFGLRDVVVAASMTTTMPRDLHSPPPPPPVAPPLTAFPPPSPTKTAVESPPPAPIGTPAPDLSSREAFAYIIFTLITVFVILYSVYLALIREDDEEEEEERDAEEGGRERRTANIDDDIDDDDASTSTSAAARSSVLSKLTNELKETMSVGNERVRKSARNMVDAWTKRGERKESRSMSFMGAFFGGKKKTKTDRKDGSSLLDYTSSGDDVASLLSVNEEDFFEEDVLETDDETMWAPYFREEEQGEDRRSYRNTSTRITRNNARNLHGGL